MLTPSIRPTIRWMDEESAQQETQPSHESPPARRFIGIQRFKKANGESVSSLLLPCVSQTGGGGGGEDDTSHGEALELRQPSAARGSERTDRWWRGWSGEDKEHMRNTVEAREARRFGVTPPPQGQTLNQCRRRDVRHIPDFMR